MFLKTFSMVCLMLVVGPHIVSASVLLKNEQIPKPDDILAVAKSPLEPVTLSQSSIMGLATTAAESNSKSTVDSTRTTRAAQSEDDSASTDPPESETTTDQPEIEPSTTESSKPEETTSVSGEATSTTEVAKVATDDSTTLGSTETTTTTSTTTTPAPTSTVTTTTTTTTTTTSPTTAEASSEDPTTTELPASPGSEQQDTTTATLSTTLSTTVATTTEFTTTTPSTTKTTTIEPEITTPSTSEESKPSIVTEAATSSSPVTQPTTESTSIISSTQRALEVTSPQPIMEKEVSDKEDKKESNDNDKKEDSYACNHFPTYSNDEVQKVFREETTYKNGTIKGKFTYINFDRRYRLVHYTRLPYGPIKVDQVEELGNPTGDSQNLSPVSGDSDNAILQLRNIMPDSLFGFPFVGPQSEMPQMRSANPSTYSASKESLTPGYSTDTLLTPNLLSPSVPVSVPPNFQRNSFMESPSQTNNQNHAPSAQQSQTSEEESKQQVGSRYFGIPSYHYPAPEAARPMEPSVYSFYPFHSSLYPSVISTQPIASDKPVLVQSTYSPSNQPTSYTPIIQQHQPHKHEHFIAPFMFVQPFEGVPGQPLLNSKIKIRVKSSKAIHSEPGRRPASQGRPGRTGKQNQDLKDNVNDKPLVYHVLRGPVRVFDMPQHDSNLALGYDSVLQMA